MKEDVTRKLPGRDQFFHMPHDKIDEFALKAKMFTQAGDNDMPDLSVMPDTLVYVGEVFQNDQDAGTTIVQLILEFASGVEWIGVDDDTACAQGAEEGNRELQHIRKHQGDSGA